MTKMNWIGASLALAIAGTVSAQSGERMVTVLTGSQQTPPVASEGFGCGTFQIDTVANRLDYRISFGGMATGESVAHIHGPAAIGASGPPQHTLPAGNPKVGAWIYPEAMEADILGGLMYVNIHSSANPSGELRGQISDLACVMDGPQAGTASAGRGWGLFELDTCMNTLSYVIQVDSTTTPETVSHIHGASLHGVGSGVAHPLPAGLIKVGTWTYSEAQEAMIVDGRTYVNIHTATNPGGEIRGQVTNSINPLDGMQAVPPNTSTGWGCTHIAIDRATDTLSYYIQYAGLIGSETVAHIHGFALPGGAAGVLHSLPAANPKLGSWTYPAGDEDSILAGLTYVNIHSSMFPGGEIRSQIQFDQPDACPADCALPHDGAVNVSDLLAILGEWGPAGGCGPCDVNGDGTVDVSDLLQTLGDWGVCP